MPKKGSEAMWSVLGNVLIALMLSAVVCASVVLSIIAHQDDSRTGEVLGVLMAAIAISTAVYVILGHHWL